MTRAEFVRQAKAAAESIAAESGLPAMVTVAQAALESGWGASELSRRANNYFGIKAHRGHAQVTMTTREVVRGAEVTVAAAFASYASMEECFRCRDHILLRGKVYAAACEKRGDEEAFLAEMARHWATDPQYAEKLRRVLREVKEMTQ